MKWDVSAFHGMISVIQFMKRSIQNGDGVISELLSKKKKKKKNTNNNNNNNKIKESSTTDA